MNVRLERVGLVVDDIARSLAFYRHLGLEFPPDAEVEPHVEVALPGGLLMTWDLVDKVRHFAPDYPANRGGRIAFAFRLDAPADVDALFEKLTSFGYRGNKVPWDSPWGNRYAIVYDPDGNLVDLFSPATT